MAPKNKVDLNIKNLTFRLEIFLNVKVFSKVDFPAPDAPIIAKSWPGRTYPLTVRKDKCKIFFYRIMK